MFTAVSAEKGECRWHFGWDKVFSVYRYTGADSGLQSPCVYICMDGVKVYFS